MRLAIDQVQVEIDSVPILDGCSVTVEHGQILGLIGPNGSGKSTLLRTIFRFLRPIAGSVHLDEDDVRRLSAREVAQRVAVVAQERANDFDLSVSEVVLMGRTPHKGLLDRDTAADHEMVRDALDRVDMGRFGGRVFGTLSGGEMQRVLLARAIAQQPKVLVLDEPTNHLDIRAQLDLLALVHRLGITTVAAIHDLNHAAGYCDRLAMLAGGRVVIAGPVEEVLTPGRIHAVFGVLATAGTHPETGRPHLFFSRDPDLAGTPR